MASQFDQVIKDALSQPPYAYTHADLATKHGFEYEQVKAAIGRHNRRSPEDHQIYIRDARYKAQLVRPSQRTKVGRILKTRKTKNVLVIGDLHEPFCKVSYLDFCKGLYDAYDCTHVVFIGDIIDNHFSSYHETDPDGLSAQDELEIAVQNVSGWVDAFPDADVCIGNHDRLISRKAQTAGISLHWVRDYNEVLNAPGWNFQEEFEYDNVRYIHGEQGTARNRAKKDLISTVQGHRHSEAYVEFLVGKNFKIFGMQVGCGIDHKSYAMAYAKAGNKPAIGAGVVLNHGEHAVIHMMNLNNSTD